METNGGTDSESDLVVLPVQVDRVHGHDVLHPEEKDVSVDVPPRLPSLDDVTLLVGRCTLCPGRLCPQWRDGQLLRPCRHVLLLRTHGHRTANAAILVVEEVPDDPPAGESLVAKYGGG